MSTETSVIFRSISPADKTLLLAVKSAAQIKTDSGAVVHVLREHAAEQQRSNSAQADRHRLQLLLIRTARAVQGFTQARTVLEEVQNELLAELAAAL